MKLKLDKKGKIKLVAIVLIGLLLILAPLIISQNETNESNLSETKSITSDEILNSLENLTNESIQNINESLGNETIVEETPTDSVLPEQVGLLNLTNVLSNPLLIPRGESPISVRINETLCVTLQRPENDANNLYVFGGCSNLQYYETIESLITQMEGNI